MTAGCPPGAIAGSELFDWLPIAIAAFALVVSLATLIYSMAARARVLVTVMEVLDKQGPQLVRRGYSVSVYNVGRRALPLSDVGFLLEDGDNSAAPSKDFQWGDERTTNPGLPRVVEPGGVVTVHLPMTSLRGRESTAIRTKWIARQLRKPGTKIQHRITPLPVNDLPTAVK